MREAQLRTDGDQPDPARDQIADWLAKLRLLGGVPVHYLVPDQRMLPIESIRFFQVDESWIVSLIDGAFSIGRSVTGDDPAEAARLQQVHALAVKKTTGIRARHFGLEAGEGSGVKSGFLLRSAVVAGWPNMEIEATNAAAKVLNVLRHERLATDIMLCIYDGLLEKVKFREPAETLHFGIEQGASGQIKQLKYVDTGPGGQEPGSIIQGVTVEVPLRDPAANNNVLDVEKLAGKVYETLKQHQGITNTPYSPAAFALEMIQGVQEVDYVIRNS
jgi:hypothetical protein